MLAVEPTRKAYCERGGDGGEDTWCRDHQASLPLADADVCCDLR